MHTVFVSMPKMADSDEDYSPEMELGQQRKPAPKSKRVTEELATLPPKGRNRQIVVGGKKETLSSRPVGRPPAAGRGGREGSEPPPLPKSSSSSSVGVHRPSGPGLPPSGASGAAPKKRQQQKPQVHRITIPDSDEEEEEEVQFNNSVQRNGGGYPSDMDCLTDDESDGTGIQISEMLNRLGSELRSRIKAKKRRIQDCFQCNLTDLV